MELKPILKECRDRMDRTVDYFQKELRGIRTGRASTALIDHVKIDYYGSQTDLNQLAAVSVPEATKIVVKPYDPGAKQEIVKAIEQADLGLNPQVDGEVVRMSVPPPSSERRKQLVGQVRKMAEESRVALRNERRDAIKNVDAAVKDKDNHLSEDDAKGAREEIDGLIKDHEKQIDELFEKKVKEIEEI